MDFVDRRVHAENEQLEIVRYERAGKRYVEAGRDA
jgi:hypothetical protein